MSWVQSRASHEITGFFTYQVGLDFKDLIFSTSKESGASLEEVLTAPLEDSRSGSVCVRGLENVLGLGELPQDHLGNGFEIKALRDLGWGAS